MNKIICIGVSLIAIAFNSLGTIYTNGGVSPSIGSWNSSTVGYVGNSSSDGTLEVSEEAIESGQGRVGHTHEGTATLTSGGSWTTHGRLIVGDNAKGTLNVTNGGNVYSTERVQIGDLAGSTGVVNVIDNGSTMSSDAHLIVGASGDGTLNIANGGDVSSGKAVVIGQMQTGTGVANVDGAGSTLTSTLALYVGFLGDGALNIGNGGDVYSGGANYIGNSTGSIGVVNVDGDGSTMTNNGDLYVGYEGDGALNINNGGDVYSGGNIWIGCSNSATGVVNVDGTNSTMTSDGTLFVGYKGDGTLSISNGGDVYSGNAISIGSQSGATGVVNVTGEGSTMANDNHSLIVGDNDDGTLNISDKGGVYSGGNIYIGNKTGSTGEVNVDGEGSTMTNASGLYVGDSGDGTLNITNGGDVYAGSQIYIGNKLGSTGEVNVYGDDSTLTNKGNLIVGYKGDGTLNIANGGDVYSQYGIFIGSYTGGTGVVNVNGEGSTMTNGGNLYVGNSGDGTLNVISNGNVYVGDATVVGNNNGSTGIVLISDSGTVTSVGNSMIGNSSGSTGSVTVTDLGSAWINSNNLYVGRSGDGTLTVSNGGEVYVNGMTTVGNSSGSDGTVLISDSGMVTSVGNSYIGNSADSTGSVTVTGNGSFWSNVNNLIVGHSGDGALTVSNGGEVYVNSGMTTVGYYSGSVGRVFINSSGTVTSVGSSRIGYYSDSTGSVTVTGNGSLWSNGNYLIVGLNGNGTLNVSNGGEVYVGGTTIVGRESGSDGTVIISKSGTVISAGDSYIGTESNSAGSVTVTDSGSLWSNAKDLVVGSSGDGALTVSNGGEVYVGGTTIVGRESGSDGTVIISKSGTVTSVGISTIGNSAGSTGSVTVTDSGSLWSNVNNLVVGNDGEGTLSVSNGGEVYVGANTVVGYGNGSTGTVLISDSGTVTSVGVSYIGYDSGSEGSVIVTGAGSTWSNGSDLVVGLDGTGSLAVESNGYVYVDALTVVGGDAGSEGTLTISDSGTVTSHGMSYIGDVSGSTGYITVTGAGSVWSNDSSLVVGRVGVGELNVESNGNVYVGGVTFVGNLNGSDGAMTISDSGTVTSVGVSTIGRNDGATGSVTVTDAGSVWSNANNLVVGNAGSGALTVSNEGSVYVGSATIVGNNNGSDGTILISESGTVTSVGVSTIGNFTGSTGSVTVTGFGSLWSNVNNLSVGNNGNGALTVSNGGDVSVGGMTYVGLASGSDGTVLVSDSGTVTSVGDSYIGTYAGSTGSVTVTDSGSVWSNESNLFVGIAGVGSVSISNGATTVVDGITYIGAGTGTGTLSISGASSSFIGNSNVNVYANGLLEGASDAIFDVQENTMLLITGGDMTGFANVYSTNSSTFKIIGAADVNIGAVNLAGQGANGGSDNVGALHVEGKNADINFNSLNVADNTLISVRWDGNDTNNGISTITLGTTGFGSSTGTIYLSADFMSATPTNQTEWAVLFDNVTQEDFDRLEWDSDVDDGWEMKFEGGSILVRYAKIPEPATLGLMLLGGFALWRHIRHRRLISDIAFEADYDQDYSFSQVEDVQEAAVKRFAAIFRDQCQ